MKFTLKQIANRCGGTLHGSDITVTQLVTDSRRVLPGCIFAVLRGERSDGFDFIAGLDVTENIAYLTDRAPAGTKNPYILVPDVLKAVGDIAAMHLETLHAMRIAVTGSVGKTTTKNFIAAALGACMKVHCAQGNRNNELGLPLTALEADKTDDAVVLEMGMRGFGQIRYLCAIAPPHVAVITNIGISHIELLGSRENILLAKSEILEALNPDGWAVLNADDDMLETLRPHANTLRYGIENEECDIRALDIVDNSFDVLYKNTKYPVKLAVQGRHNIYNALAALGVGIALGCDISRLIEGIESFSGDGKRQNIYEFEGLRIFDDTYNASPASMAAAMEIMRAYEGKKLLVLADMLELGDFSVSAHRALADNVRALGADRVICIGENMRHLYDALGSQIAFHCTDNTQALDRLMKLAKPGDNILFKGSNKMDLAGLLEKFRGGWTK